MSDEAYSGLRRPPTRAARHGAIQQALSNSAITSQQQLATVLATQGIEVTQATLSRDLDEMHASKQRQPDGSFAYVVPESTVSGEFSKVRPMPDDEDDAEHGAEHSTLNRAEQQLSRTLTGLVTSVATAQNLVVIHTPSGAAQYVASVLDRQSIQGVVGTIAGDDTVMAIAVDAETAQDKAEWFLLLASGGESSHMSSKQQG
ncbi:arginine repressor [Bifidobacterium aquikefiricola]|uniref:Arginine repressor n=1 Tax=Bifidobacterium aquikefiricola TaxID=3059038 RepID=A0AB39U4I0_9BIFI